MSTKKSSDLHASRLAVGSGELAPPDPLDEDPTSIINRTATVQNEQDALNAISFNLVNLQELEMRIGLLARIVLEHNLRDKRNLTPREKCDIALRAITALEGSKQEVTWREELLRKPAKKSLEAYQAERAEREKRLKSILLRKKEVQLARAEDALEEIEKRKKPTDEVEVN